MTKWPEKRACLTHSFNDNDFTNGEDCDECRSNITWNASIDAYRAALNEACSREELENFINDWLSQRHGFTYDGILARDLSDAIRKHLGVEDSKEGESNET